MPALRSPEQRQARRSLPAHRCPLSPRRDDYLSTQDVTLVSRMAVELPEGLQKHVFDTISGAFKSRDVLEAERSEAQRDTAALP